MNKPLVLYTSIRFSGENTLTLTSEAQRIVMRNTAKNKVVLLIPSFSFFGRSIGFYAFFYNFCFFKRTFIFYSDLNFFHVKKFAKIINFSLFFSFFICFSNFNGIIPYFSLMYLSKSFCVALLKLNPWKLASLLSLVCSKSFLTFLAKALPSSTPI